MNEVQPTRAMKVFLWVGFSLFAILLYETWRIHHYAVQIEATPLPERMPRK
jgi:hypothetical protein